MGDPSEHEALKDAVARVTGADEVSMAYPTWQMRKARFLHLFGLHSPGPAYLWDEETGSLKFLGEHCVICEK